MNRLSPLLFERGPGALYWWCPGCKTHHWITTEAFYAAGEAGPRWTWDGNAEAPTFSPSVLTTYNGSDAGNDAPPKVCHLFVRAGKIEYLADCTHVLAGQTVPMEPTA